MIDRGRRRNDGYDPLVYGFSDFLYGIEVERVAHSQIQLVLYRADGYYLILLRHVLRHGLRKLRRNVDLGKIDKIETELHLQRVKQLLFRDQTVLDKNGTETLFCAFL